jgi:hypothetical protein
MNEARAAYKTVTASSFILRHRPLCHPHQLNFAMSKHSLGPSGSDKESDDYSSDPLGNMNVKPKSYGQHRSSKTGSFVMPEPIRVPESLVTPKRRGGPSRPVLSRSLFPHPGSGSTSTLSSTFTPSGYGSSARVSESPAPASKPKKQQTKLVRSLVSGGLKEVPVDAKQPKRRKQSTETTALYGPKLELFRPRKKKVKRDDKERVKNRVTNGSAKSKLTNFKDAGLF